MKKICAVLALMVSCSVLALCFAGCGGSEKTSTASPQASKPTALAEASAGKAEISSGKAKALIVYYSWSGNTKQVADEIQKQTGADVFEVVPSKPYTKDYDAVVKLAREEKESNVRPAINGTVDHLENYDTIFVGFPNWWSDMPMVLYTFFDAHDLSGKKIVPFCTHGGGGFAGSVRAIKALEPNAEVLDGLSISGSAAGNSQGAVASWLRQLGFTK